jgi:hypothetical protein
MYRNGKGVKKDDEKAVLWLKKAADQGDSDAQVALGEMCWAGSKAVGLDWANGLQYFKLAAAKNHPVAQHWLGEMYRRGWGVDRDSAKAFGWFMKAAQQGDAYSQCRVGAFLEAGDGVPRDINAARTWYKKAASGSVEASKALDRLGNP